MSCIVIGLGQRVVGDDAAGLAVIDELERRGTPGALPDGTVLLKGRDASALLELRPTGQHWIIVDAVLAEPAQVGQVTLLSTDDLDRSARCSVSSHGISVAQALELRRALHAQPTASDVSTVQLVAIGIAPPRRYEDGLSPEVQQGVQRAANLIERLCADLTLAG